MANRERNSQSASEKVSRSAGEYAYARFAPRYRACDFHHCSITAEREDHVVVRRVLLCELRRMARPFGEHHIAINRTAHQRFTRMVRESLALTRRRLGDDNGASNQ